MSKRNLSPEIISLIEDTFDNTINNYEVTVHANDSGGQGYLGEMVFVSLKNIVTRKNTHLVVKQAIPANTSSNAELMQSTYFNEIHFYKNIWSAFENFLQSFPGVSPFDKIPKYYASIIVSGKEKLILENLKYSGFEMFPRAGHFDEEQTKVLMKIYGQFHGISAAFREHNPDEYRRLIEELKNSTECVLNMELFSGYIFGCMKELDLMVTNEKIKKKLKTYIERGPQIAIDSTKYNGKNPVVNHGDCWSNNMMVKFAEEGALLDVRFFDFQLCRNGSVVSDLSYLLYSGVTKEIFGNLDYYLKIYHDSFSDTLRSFDLDPSKIFSFEDLKKEWKNHSAFGFIMSQVIWRGKLSQSFEKRNLVELDEKNDNVKNSNDTNVKYAEKYNMDTRKVKEICLDLVQHFYENDFL